MTVSSYAQLYNPPTYPSINSTQSQLRVSWQTSKVQWVAMPSSIRGEV
jgi:hypothetical protein